MADKSSAVAEVGDRLATIDMGRNWGLCPPPFLGGGAGSEDNSSIGRTVLVRKGRPKITVHGQNHGIRGDRESVFISQPYSPSSIILGG